MAVINIILIFNQIFLMVDTRLKGKTLIKARRMLDTLVNYLEKERMEYHLEGGTLLGFVRDGEFLEWDFDLDLSIPSHEAKKFLRYRYKLWINGYRVSRRTSKVDYGPIRKGEIRILKVKSIWYSLAANFVPSMSKRLLVADIFIKFDNMSDVFWIAKRKIMKVPGLHYAGFDTIEYQGRSYRTPVKYNEYLTLKYGNWSIPVGDWNCGRDEKTIVASVKGL